MGGFRGGAEGSPPPLSPLSELSLSTLELTVA